MKWFFANGGNFLSFSYIIKGMPNSVYTSELVEYLLAEFWADQ